MYPHRTWNFASLIIDANISHNIMGSHYFLHIASQKVFFSQWAQLKKGGSPYDPKIGYKCNAWKEH
jgi:hypothetical protein